MVMDLSLTLFGQLLGMLMGVWVLELVGSIFRLWLETWTFLWMVM